MQRPLVTTVPSAALLDVMDALDLARWAPDPDARADAYQKARRMLVSWYRGSRLATNDDMQTLGLQIEEDGSPTAAEAEQQPEPTLPRSQ